ncbi:hypothetical protein REPUB_Repub01dG0092000 [Reevesia pubescens]
MLMKGINNFGGPQINLQGGNYLISKPLRLPAAGAGNLMIHGGTLRASDNFPADGTSIDNCYITHFTTTEILVQHGHETYIRNSFLGQHITVGGDAGERNFSGTAINLMGIDNAVKDVVIFSAAIGIIASGQANTFSEVHCYNKATDPVQLHISSSFFLDDAFILLKLINWVANGVNILDNMFSGSNKGVEIVQLDQSKGPFKDIDQVVVDRNNVRGMNIKATIARGVVHGNGSSWTVDFNPVLLFPNLIKHVQYSLSSSGSSFPSHALRNVSNNRVVIELDVVVPANLRHGGSSLSSRPNSLILSRLIQELDQGFKSRS